MDRKLRMKAEAWEGEREKDGMSGKEIHLSARQNAFYAFV